MARPEITESRLRIAETISLLARVSIVALMLAGLWFFSRERKRVERSHAVITTLKAVQRDVMTAQHSHAEFLLSGKSLALCEYARAMTHSDVEIVSLDLLTASDTLQAARRARLAAGMRGVRQRRTSTRELDATSAGTTRTISREPMRHAFADSLRGLDVLIDSLFVTEQQMVRERRTVEERIHVRTPGITGVQLVEQMEAEGMALPVLLISGQLDQQLPHKWPAQAYVRFVPKPISGLALRRAVLELIEDSSSGRNTKR